MLTVRSERFTERQRQVVHLIARGCSNVEIADRLGISPRTAKAHSDTLRIKLGVARRRQIPAAFRDATGEDPHELEGLERVPVRAH
jgi:DNA-binding CsgD family transcriptional regulator